METVNKINVNEVKKELLKSKVSAKLSHYVSGNLYYTVDLSDGIYQFPISTIEKEDLSLSINLIENEVSILKSRLELGGPFPSLVKSEKEKEIEKLLNEIQKLQKFQVLSSDLGTTSFYNEMRGSELNRWISKSIEKNEFIKIS